MDQEVAAPAAPEAAPAPAAVVDPNATAAPDSPKEEAKPERTFSQKELDEILERRLAKEARKRREIENRLRITEELALRSKAPDPKPEAPQGDGAPKRDAFESYEAYLEAKAEWKAEQALDRRLAEREKKDKEAKSVESQRQAVESFKKVAEKFSQEAEDFEEVMAASDAPLSDYMREAILAAGEEGPRVAYHLAKNPAEAERIASLPASVQAREIWALEVKLKSAPAPKKPSKAPEPLAPVGGKAGAPGTDELTGKESPEEFRRKREAQIAARRRGHA